MELIRQRLFDTLKKLGLEPIVVQGEPFDPHIHHAVEMVETEEAPDHTVLAEFSVPVTISRVSLLRVRRW